MPPAADTSTGAPSAATSRESITGVILAGGRGQRLGGQDKGLLLWNDQPMIVHVLALLRPQVGDIIINANRNAALYAALGCRVVSDKDAGYLGPLAGMASGLAAASTPYVTFAPCDAPVFPTDLIARFAKELVRANAEAVFAHDGMRSQPLFVLLSRSLLPALLNYLDSGRRDAQGWLATLRTSTVSYAAQPDAFLNINELGQFESHRHHFARTTT